MNGVPAIGRARGLFDIFVPGVFLLLNLALGLWLLPLDLTHLTSKEIPWISSPVFGTIVVISFGYLLGVILRILRVNSADKWSAWFIKLWTWPRWRKKGSPPIYLTELFPFIECWRDRYLSDYPEEAAQFYDQVWSGRSSGRQGQRFFNFCKTMVSSEDKWAAGEMYANEALSRYIASICYALLFSFVFLSLVEIIRYYANSPVDLLAVFLLIFYGSAIFAILRNFRYIRVKEVQIVIDITFKNRDVLFASRKRDHT
ncbi:hypothetical protein KKG05_09030 [bacterium]|nr:hypothetical protein [bacterium]